MTTNYKEAEKLSGLAKEKKLFLFEAITTLYFEIIKNKRLDWENWRCETCSKPV